jgi:hypothetical protein
VVAFAEIVDNWQKFENSWNFFEEKLRISHLWWNSWQLTKIWELLKFFWRTQWWEKVENCWNWQKIENSWNFLKKSWELQQERNLRRSSSGSSLKSIPTYLKTFPNWSSCERIPKNMWLTFCRSKCTPRQTKTTKTTWNEFFCTDTIDAIKIYRLLPLMLGCFGRISQILFFFF